jgi:hypothetical protein
LNEAGINWEKDVYISYQLGLVQPPQQFPINTPQGFWILKSTKYDGLSLGGEPEEIGSKSINVPVSIDIIGKMIVR